MRLRSDPLVRWGLVAVAPAAVYAGLTLGALFGVECEWSLDPQRFCAWWSHSWLPTAIGMPLCLAFGCWAGVASGSRRPPVIAAVLVVLTCLYLRGAAAPVAYAVA
jgi:hypothetical protein